MEDLAMLALRNLNSLPNFVEEFFQPRNAL